MISTSEEDHEGKQKWKAYLDTRDQQITHRASDNCSHRNASTRRDVKSGSIWRKCCGVPSVFEPASFQRRPAPAGGGEAADADVTPSSPYWLRGPFCRKLTCNLSAVVECSPLVVGFVLVALPGLAVSSAVTDSPSASSSAPFSRSHANSSPIRDPDAAQQSASSAVADDWVRCSQRGGLG